MIIKDNGLYNSYLVFSLDDLGAVWFRGYPQVVRGSHWKIGCHTFGLLAGRGSGIHIHRNIR
jgi:hypothetical protein